MNPSIALMLAMLICGASSAVAVEPADRPASIDPKQWIKISDGFGFVVVEATQRPEGTRTSPQVLLVDPAAVSAQHSPPKKGYFVIRTAAGWQPVVLTEPTPTVLGDR